jgi:3',5'-cyclic AMP phosphodiesterase CpdA
MLTRRQILLAALASQPLLRGNSRVLGPWLQNVQAGSATLVWCGSSADGRLEWNNQTISGAATPLEDGRFLWKCRIPLETAPAPGQDLRFLAFGDSGTGSPEQNQLLTRLESEAADIVLHTGDLAYPLASDQTLEEHYIRPYMGLMSRAPFYPCPGNHDTAGGYDAYLRWHSLPPSTGAAALDRGRYYRIGAQGVDFFVLDSNESLWEGQRMISWLERELSTSQAFWRIVVFHHPPYTTGKHANDATCRLAAEQLAPRLEAARIPLVLNGHEHCYQHFRSTATDYVVTGGGGAGLYAPGAHPKLIRSGFAHHYVRARISGWRLDLEAIGSDGTILDEFRLAPPPRINSVVDSAGFSPRLAPGGLATIFGPHLAARASEVRITLDDQPLPLIGQTGSQVNFCLPQRGAGKARLAIETPNGKAETDLELLPSAPSLFRDAQGRLLEQRLSQSLRLWLTGSGGRRVRLRSGLRDLGFFEPAPVAGWPGVEQIEIPLSQAPADLAVESI